MCSKVVLDEKIIECVRRHEVLYNTDVKEYSDNSYKLKIWHQIAKTCGMTSGEEAKKYWKNLRDGYRSALKLYKSNKSDPSKRVKTWKYFDQMKFLRPYMRDRQRNTNISAEFSEDTDIPDENSQEQRPGGVVKEEMSDIFETPDLIEFDNDGYFQSDSPTPSKKMCLTSNSRNEQIEETEWSHSDLCQGSEDGLKLFFDSMYASTKKLPSTLQRLIKNKLFQAVNDAEVEMEQIVRRD